MRVETAGCVVFSRSAALRKLPKAATRRNVSNCLILKGIIVSIKHSVPLKRWLVGGASLSHDNLRANLRASVKVDDVLIGQANAS